MNSSTGEIVTLDRLDREQTAVYHLTLVAQDSSPTEPKAAAVNLTITVTDLNDNAPRFASPRYTAYVPDSTGKGACSLSSFRLFKIYVYTLGLFNCYRVRFMYSGDFVFGAKATDDDDGDNSRIVYRLHGKDSHRFAVDPHSGVIRAQEKLASGDRNMYQLQIEASDSGVEPRSVSADLVVHLWQRQLFPSFRPATATRFTLIEDVPEGRVITTLSATTPKEGPSSDLVFGMAGGNVGEALRIEPHTGEVRISLYDLRSRAFMCH